MKDLHLLPKFRDSWSYLYVEHCRIDQEDKAIAVHDARGKVPVPCATLALLMLGPGTTITHAAVKTLAECGCSVLWTGENAVRYYAQGLGETRSAGRLLHQARLCSDPDQRLQVVLRLYRMRFQEDLDNSLTLRQIRGMEGVRVRQAYAEASRESGVPWSGRTYRRDRWSASDEVNRALSAANSCLYGVCHAAILSLGYSPALGFIHTGKMLSFVYDVADLYKTELTIPMAFRAAAEKPPNLETRVRYACRESFHRGRLLERVVHDIDPALAFNEPTEDQAVDEDEALPGGLWDPEKGRVAGGRNQADD
jgi:CRISPR-associated protein Cas1